MNIQRKATLLALLAFVGYTTYQAAPLFMHAYPGNRVLQGAQMPLKPIPATDRAQNTEKNYGPWLFASSEYPKRDMPAKQRVHKLIQSEIVDAQEFFDGYCEQPDNLRLVTTFESESLASLKIGEATANCDGRMRGYGRWMNYDLIEGKEYDLTRLYSVLVSTKESNGSMRDSVLAPSLRHLYLMKAYPNKGSGVECERQVAKELPRATMEMILAKDGVVIQKVAEYNDRICWGEVSFTYQEIAPYLNKKEAERLGWSSPK